jgi:hypothetical protein
MERTYEGFLKSTKSNKPTPTKEDIETCFLDLIDDGFNVVITYPNVNYKYEFIEIDRDDDYPECWFRFDSIKETLLFAIPYLSENYNFKINKISARYMNGKVRHGRNPQTNKDIFVQQTDNKMFNDIDDMCEFFNKFAGYDYSHHRNNIDIISEVNISFSVDGVTKNISRTGDGGPR